MLEETLKRLNALMGFERNPHWEKWGKGRPSKEKLAKRKLAFEWNREQREKYPERYPALFRIQNPEDDMIIEGEGRQVRIKYRPRASE
jgi:hypothetical protein